MDINKEFLYKKVRAIGDIDDSGNYDIDSWFTDNSWGELKSTLSESSLEDLIINLVGIFRDGNPNYKEIDTQLEVSLHKRKQGHEIIENQQENKIVWVIHEVDRENKDIARIEMHINSKDFVIKKLYIYVCEMPTINSLKNKISVAYGGILYGAADNLVICEKECTIFVLNKR